MIQLRPSQARGHANHGWLDAHHTFSFAGYFDRDHMGFGPLRVLNQDRVEPGRGFGTHGHDNMEIVTWVLEGRLEHKDSMGNGSQLLPGEVQLMSAGTGVTHSEFNPSKDERLHLLQMWVLPATRGLKPSYQQKHFADAERKNRLRLVVSPDGSEGSLQIRQDARLYVGDLAAQQSLRLEVPRNRLLWLHVPRGSVQLNGQALGPGDGAGIQAETLLHFQGPSDPSAPPGEIVLWDLPATPA
jgi:quercetin 2,3-dioxygenase